MNKSICLGIISGGSIKTETVSCILDMISNLPVPAHVMLPIGGYAAQSRNMVVDAALKAGDTHVLYVDADMVFPSTGIRKLVLQEKDIIGVNYHQRQLQPVSTIKIEDNDGNYIEGSEKDFPIDTFECAAVGTGFCLVDIKVYKAMSFPYYRADYIDGEFNTEDVWFCKQAKKLGFRVWCDNSIIVQHIGDFRF